MDLHVQPGDSLTAARWNALVDLASGKSRPIEYRFSVPKRASGSSITAAKVTGTWARYLVDLWKTTAELESGEEIELVAAPPTGTGYTNSEPKIKQGSRVRVWKNGGRWEMLDDPREFEYTIHAEGTVSGGDLILEFYLD